MRCERCPVAASKTCLGDAHPETFGGFCGWAASGDANLAAHVVRRSEIGHAPPEPAPAVERPQPPSLLKKAATLAGAVAAHVADGCSTPDDATLARRLETCDACEHIDPANTTCRLCGCFTRWKAALRTQNCPIGKW